MNLIENIQVGSGGVAQIEFSAIPQTYRDLVLLVNLRNSRVEHVGGLTMVFNGGVGGSAFCRRIYAAGATNLGYATGAANIQSAFIGTSSATWASNGVYASFRVYIGRYTASESKNYLAESAITSLGDNGGTYPGYTEQNIMAGAWTGSAPVTSLTLVTDVGTFVEFSTASLYGIV
jgi:hypothetical protein